MKTKNIRITSNAIALHSGAYLDFESPETSEFSIEDIACALSNLCRFTGHCKQFYSVAEHSVHVSRIVPPEFAFAGLMHDAAEAFIGDVAKPLKNLLPDYAAIEERVERAVFRRFGLPLEKPPEVGVADLQMLAVEQRQAMGDENIWPCLEGLPSVDVELGFWMPGLAHYQFIQRYNELVRGGRT